MNNPMKKYYQKKTYKEIRLLQLEEKDEHLFLSFESFLMELGRVEHRQNTEQKQGNLSGFLSQLKKYQFEEISEEEFKKNQETAAQELMNKYEEKSTDTYQIVTWEVIKEQFAPQFQHSPEEYLANKKLRNFCLYPQSTIIEGDFLLRFDSLAPSVQTTQRNIVIAGNLTITGNLDASNIVNTLPQYLFITGDLKAQNIILSGWAQVCVLGNVTVENLIFGYYGESGGAFKVLGKVDAPKILNGWMYRFDFQEVKGQKFSFDMDDSEDSESTYIPENIEANNWESVKNQLPLTENAYYYEESSQEYNFIFEQAVKLLQSGETIFKD
jgi:hypothetical protein